jgi:putative membrane protein
MMNMKRIFATGALICLFGAASGLAYAADKIDADDFVEEVSAKGIAEVESAKMAQQKSSSADIKAFAHKMIAEHSAANAELAAIASQKKLEVSNEAEMSNKAKKFMMEQRDGESFDKAYAKNQVAAHENTIELFQRATISDDAEIAAFATKTLPKLHNHLKMAKELAATYDKK